RHSEDPERHRVALTQAPPGLAGAVVSRALLDDLAAAEAQGAGALATLGSLFAYTPRRSKPDPIGSSLCAQIDPRVRNARGRFVLDSDAHAAWMERLLTRLDANADATA